MRFDGNNLKLVKSYKKNFETLKKTRTLNIEIFTDWTPNDNSFISVDEKYKDKYGIKWKLQILELELILKI